MDSEGPQCRLMVVDDNPAVREMLTKAFRCWGAEVIAAPDGPAALEAAEAGQLDITITDIKMPGMDGHELLRQLKALDSDMDVVMITAYGTIDSAVQAMRDGATDYITKPFSLEEIRLKLERVCNNRHLREENRALRSQLRDSFDICNGTRLIGSSPSMHSVYQTIEAVAGNRSKVLIQGETGTGKELVAKAIHHRGPRADGPFIALTCGSTSKSLLESQLFGHVKGAFTGAVKDSPGFFVAATGGTLFLDEITEVDTDTQVRLLRALQEKEVTPVGGTKPVPFDARIIAATNRDVREAVDEGLLRRDLYYRLSVVVIDLPPLRERKDDIPVLADHFNARMSAEYGLDLKKLSEEAMDALVAHDWPGNVRELEGVVERVYALGEGPVVLPGHLPPEIANGRPASSPQPAEGSPAAAAQGAEGSPAAAAQGAGQASVEAPTLRHSEEELVRRALSGSGWNKSEAARKLGIDRKRLYRMIRKYKIARPELAVAV